MLRLESETLTDVGRVRERNEDAVAAEPERGLVAVADGMGGHPAGDVASALAVETVLETYRSPRSADESEGDAPGERMAEAVRRANRRILEEGRSRPERRGMGTTLTALELDAEGRRWVVGHVGDSRAYLYREGALRPITRDHTPLQEQVDAGRMTREAARIHPMSSVLSKALGTQPRVEADVSEGDVRPGDLFLLCTDGLLAVLSEAEIEAVVESGARDELSTLARRLVDRTTKGGAPDNVTVALLRVSEGA